MDVESRLLLLQHLHRTGLRTTAGAAGVLPPDVKKRIFAEVETLVWSLPPDVFAGVEDVEEEGWEARVAQDPRVREPFERLLAGWQAEDGAAPGA